MKNKTSPKPSVDERLGWYYKQIMDKKREKFGSLLKLVLSLAAVVVAVLLYAFIEGELLSDPIAILGGIIVFLVFDICLYAYIKDWKELKRLQWMAEDYSSGLSLSHNESPIAEGRADRKKRPHYTPRL